MAVTIDQSGPNPVVVSGAHKAISLRSLLRNQKVTLADIPDSKSRFAVPRVDPSGFPIINLSSSQYGALTVNSLVAASLSAISANIGTLVINKGGSLSSGETAYAVGSGFWLGTDSLGNPQFSLQDTEGNFINIAASGTNVLAISSSGLINALSSKQIDDLGWRNTAIWLDLTGTPTTRSGYGITDAQGTLPNATAVGQVLQRDNGGAPYFNQKYGPEINVGVTSLAGSGLTSAVLVQVGDTLGFVNPGSGINAVAFLSWESDVNLGNELLEIHLQYSLNGGSSWTDIQAFSGGHAIPISTATSCLCMGGAVTGINCTGDLQFRVMAANASAANTLHVNQAILSAWLIPNGNYYSTAAALSSTIPATGSGSCTATAPATTCTASVNVAVTPSGGSPPYTFLWSVVSGTGTITSGSTSQICTVSDTETATTGGATHTTTIHCKVTDSVPNNVTSSNDVITNTFTLVYSPITATVSPLNGSCSNKTCGVSCTATGTATANPSGGNGSYTYSWSVVSGPASIVSGGTSQTCTLSESHQTTQGPRVDNTTVQCSVNDTRGTGAVTPQGIVSLTFSCPQL